jgi:hypothetical protein
MDAVGKDKMSPERLQPAFDSRQDDAILSESGSDLGLVGRVKESP